MPHGKKPPLHQSPKETAPVGKQAVSLVGAVLELFEQQPYMISATYLAELRDMSAAWAAVSQRCDLFEQEQAATRAETVLDCDGQAQAGVICNGHMYLGGSDAVEGTPLSLDLWAQILLLLELGDRISFSRVSKACLGLQRSLIKRLDFGHAAPSGSKALATARKMTRESCGLTAEQEIEVLLNTPRCRQVVVGRPMFGYVVPGTLPLWYYWQVVCKALERCPAKEVALTLTHLRESGQINFIHRLYCRRILDGASTIAMNNLSCVVIHTKRDLLALLKIMCDAVCGTRMCEAHLLPPILFECDDPYEPGPAPSWKEQGLSKWRWDYSKITTRAMTKFKGIFVRSRDAFEELFELATSGTKMTTNGPGELTDQLSPLFYVMFPIYIDSQASADRPEQWSRAARYLPDYFREGEADGLITHLLIGNKSLNFLR